MGFKRHKSGTCRIFVWFNMIGRDECNRFVSAAWRESGSHYFVFPAPLPRVESVALFSAFDAERSLFICERGDIKMTNEEQQSWAVRQLQEKQAEMGRLPLKSDFDVVTLSRIKAFLGPWPRALEKAELKEKKEAEKSKTSHKRKSRKRSGQNEI